MIIYDICLMGHVTISLCLWERCCFCDYYFTGFILFTQFDCDYDKIGQYYFGTSSRKKNSTPVMNNKSRYTLFNNFDIILKIPISIAIMG